MELNPPNQNLQTEIPQTQYVQEVKCPKCNTITPLTNYFCPNCGYKLKDLPPSTSIGKQIGIYLFCIFLPPFGLWPAFRYIRQQDSKSKKIGIAAIVLTVLSLVVSIYFATVTINTFTKQLNGELNMYNQVQGY